MPRQKFEYDLTDPVDLLVIAAEDAADDMRAIINAWESGDLAGAVNALDPARLRRRCRNVRRKLRRLREATHGSG